MFTDKKGQTATTAWALVFFFLITPPIVIYLPFRKFWKGVFPKVQGWLARKKITKFREKDIKYDEQEKKYYCELVSFDNIILDYKATQDFSRYLELFEIKEHNFKYYIKTRFKRHKKKKNKERAIKERKSRQLNEWIWYARFYFKQKPKKGFIEVIYK